MLCHLQGAVGSGQSDTLNTTYVVCHSQCGLITQLCSGSCQRGKWPGGWRSFRPITSAWSTGRGHVTPTLMPCHSAHMQPLGACIARRGRQKSESSMQRRKMDPSSSRERCSGVGSLKWWTHQSGESKSLKWIYSLSFSRWRHNSNRHEKKWPHFKGLWSKFVALRSHQGVLQRAWKEPATVVESWQVVVSQVVA